MSLKKQLRDECIQRDGRCCRKCDAYFPKKGLQLHHVIPQRLHGPDEHFNLVCLCGGCHQAWHTHETKIGATWDPKKAKEEFFRWIRSEDPLGESRDLEESLQQHLEDQLRDLLLSLTFSRKRRKQPRCLHQITRR